MKKKILSIFVIFLVSFGFFGETYSTTLNASEINSQTTEKHIEEISNDVIVETTKEELLEEETNIEQEEKELIESVPENAIIIDTSVEEEKEYLLLSDNKNALNLAIKKQEEFDSHLSYDGLTYTLDQEVKGVDSNGSTYKLKQIDSDVVLEYDGRDYYYIENDYVNFVEPEEIPKAKRSTYNYKYTSHITNKKWVTVVSVYMTSVGTVAKFVFPGVGWMAPAVGKGISAGVKAYQSTKATLYGKMKVYQYKNCGWKGKKIIYWYSGRTITSRGYSYNNKYYAKKQTIYYDNTPYNQVCR